MKHGIVYEELLTVGFEVSGSLMHCLIPHWQKYRLYRKYIRC